jgi:hypothetical protein
MRGLKAAAFAAFVSTALAGLYPPDATDQLGQTALANWKTYLASNPAAGNCTYANAIKRQEWYDLPRTVAVIRCQIADRL